MKNYIRPDAWCIIEEGFNPEYNRISESLCSIGNGKMGQRANFEEKYSGDSLQGSYVAGVYYPDKTRVGWWKNGYPEYFAKVLNAPNWIGVHVALDGEEVDLAHCEITAFNRTLNMQEGYLERTVSAKLPSGKEINIHSKRFCSLVDDEVGAIQYEVQAVNFGGKVTLTPFIDADVMNEDANYDEKFWDPISQSVGNGEGYVTVKTKKTGFVVTTGMGLELFKNDEKVDFTAEPSEKEKFVSNQIQLELAQGDRLVVYKYAAILSSQNHDEKSLTQNCQAQVNKAISKGFDAMLDEQAKAWASKWEESDIVIEGDVPVQQGIRFNIFQLYQTYTGEDPRLNIGPKGFTGEKYGGSTYWDTEAYCLPFYLSTADDHVGRNLLVYRFKHLQKAIENAQKLGFRNGAALYPMVTMNGEECHNEWEITFEEIHRNGAIAYAIFEYINYTGDKSYLAEYGLEVLIGISRFWAQRVNFSQAKKKYVMLGVTGPNEYENNVNNNWYTSTIACWTMDYTRESINYVKQEHPEKIADIITKTHFQEAEEMATWKEISENMFYPEDPEQGIFLQQEGYLDKELIAVKDLDPENLPLNQKWSWDRILRSCYIKQADVLQGMYMLEDRYDVDTLKRNFDFYEPKTVHESSLSPCIHVILASKIGYQEKAYEMYLRTARLDLDDYNNDTEDGCHITSMAGTWMAFVKGFGGMRVKDEKLHFDPFIPAQWKSYDFKIRFRGFILDVKVSKEGIEIVNHSDSEIALVVKGEEKIISPRQDQKIPY